MADVFSTLTTWTEQILTDPRMYASTGIDLSWMPRKSVPDAKTIKDYELKRVEPIEGSLMGSSVTMVSTALEETTRSVLSWRAGVSINRHDVTMANQGGYNILQNSLRPVVKKFLAQLAQVVLQGTTASRDKVDISGMIDLGEDTDSALDDDTWDTEAAPFTHVKEGVKDMISNGYNQPYTMIMSNNLYTGFYSLHNAAGGLTEANLAFGTGIPDPVAKMLDNAVFYENGTDASNVVYPLPAASNDDGVWIMCKPDVENFFIGEIEPINTLPWEFNRINNAYETIVQWRGTFVCRDGAAIVYEPDVDLA